MNAKERVLATMEGNPVDRFPVCMTWQFLYVEEHLHELTGKPAWWTKRLRYLEPDNYVALLREVYERVPLDMIEPLPGCASQEERERQEFVKRDGQMCRHDTGMDEWAALEQPTASGYPQDGSSNQERRVFTREQVDEFISVVPAGELFRNGELDHREAANKAFGGNRFILALGPPSTLGMCDVMFGQTNTLVMLREEPELVDYVAERSLQRTIQQIRRAAEVGADGMYFYDHMSTGDLISPADYDRFCRPVIARMVYEAHSLGMKTLVCCYGNVMDRLDLIASTGADALQVECAMKGYANDIDAIAERIGDRMTLFSNIDPIWCLEKATEEELTSEIRRQIAAGRKSRGFILGPASPITPATPLRRVQRFIELCHDLGTQRQRPNVPSGP